jgi:signal transduction histidine kinase
MGKGAFMGNDERANGSTEWSADSERAVRPAQDGAESDVLVVDDDSNNLVALGAVLDGLGLRVTCARSGEDALRHVLRRAFAVVLLDINLPGLSGFETARLIRSRDRYKHLPIIFITGHSHNHEDVQRGYELGAVDYLFKPIVPGMLRAKVKVFVDLHERTAQVARQAELLREAEAVEASRKLQAERRRWEAEELRRQIRHERRVNEQLSEADRRKDEFIALLAHELRNPLVPLVTGLRLVATRDPADPVIAEARDKMERHVLHLKRLVDDLTDIARIRQGKLEMSRTPIDLRDVIDQAREMCRDVIGRRRQTLTIEGIEQAVPIHADSVRMTQVVCNLLSNASRYSNHGGRIWLRCGIEAERVIVRVVDEGRGIRPQFIERVFDPFAQERQEGRGLGLGLALVRQIVEKHGGSVEVASEGPGRGSEFVVELPACLTWEDCCHAEPASPASPARTKALRVVLVDDCVDIRDLLGHLVSEWGHTVVGTAGTGRAAIEQLRALRPDAAIVDINLPDLDGYEVARQIRATLADDRPGLVALSGYGQERDQRLALDAGFDVMLVKPPDPGELRETLERTSRPARRRQSSAMHVAASIDGRAVEAGEAGR